MKILFVCSQNRWRSLTAQDLYRDFPGYEVRSAGIHKRARIKLTSDLLDWADRIFVMERSHQKFIRENFGESGRSKEILCLNIPDRYEYMNPILLDMLKEKLAPYIEVPE